MGLVRLGRYYTGCYMICKHTQKKDASVLFTLGFLSILLFTLTLCFGLVTAANRKVG